MIRSQHASAIAAAAIAILFQAPPVPAATLGSERIGQHDPVRFTPRGGLVEGPGAQLEVMTLPPQPFLTYEFTFRPDQPQEDPRLVVRVHRAFPTEAQLSATLTVDGRVADRAMFDSRGDALLRGYVDADAQLACVQVASSPGMAYQRVCQELPRAAQQRQGLRADLQRR